MSTSPNCVTCGAPHTEHISYGNHLGLSRRLIQAKLAEAVRKLRATVQRKRSAFQHNTAFSPFETITRCVECGHGYYGREFLDGELAAYYHSQYGLAVGLPQAAWNDSEFATGHPKTKGQWDFVAEYLGRDQNLAMLDIGAAASRISRIAKIELGSRVSCSVVEPGEGWLPYYAHHGIRVAGRFFPCPDNRLYDYVHTSHWLEHVAELEPVLVALRSRLKTGGHCFIEVPNCGGDYFALDFPDTPHIHFFTLASLKRVMEAHGFETIRIIECAAPNREYLPYLRNARHVSAGEREAIRDSEAQNVSVPEGNILRGLFRAVEA